MSLEYETGKVRVLDRGEGTPWIEIEVPDGAIAIWKTTGAVHPQQADGAVVEAPLPLPAPTEEG